MFDHPRRSEIDGFHAARLGIEGGAAVAGIVLQDRELTDIVVFDAPGFSVIQASPASQDRVSRALRAAHPGEAGSALFRFVESERSIEQVGTRDLTFYLDTGRFRPAAIEGVRTVTTREAPLLRDLRAAVNENQRWYVEPDHEGLHARFREGAIVAAASHLPESGSRITDLGVLTHPAARRRGYGKAATSAALQWGLDRDLICQWVTTDRNRASLALAESLGFDHYGTETVFRFLEDV